MVSIITCPLILQLALELPSRCCSLSCLMLQGEHLLLQYLQRPLPRQTGQKQQERERKGREEVGEKTRYKTAARLRGE